MTHKDLVEAFKQELQRLTEVEDPTSFVVNESLVEEAMHHLEDIEETFMSEDAETPLEELQENFSKFMELSNLVETIHALLNQQTDPAILN